MSTNWDKELAKIDKQLASISDEELLKASSPPPATRGKGGAPAAPAATTPARALPAGGGASRWHGVSVALRVVLAVLLAGFVLFWPYPKRCGMQLGGYLAATGVVTLAGVWASIWSWRHRTAFGHLLGLAATVCGLVLAALEVLPRIGYAVPTTRYPATWSCVTPTPQPAPAPQSTTPAPTTTTPTAPAPQPNAPAPQSTTPPTTTTPTTPAPQGTTPAPAARP